MKYPMSELFNITFNSFNKTPKPDKLVTKLFKSDTMFALCVYLKVCHSHSVKTFCFASLKYNMTFPKNIVCGLFKQIRARIH